VAAERAGVTFEWGVEVTVDRLLALAPDHVVLATGAAMTRPMWLPAEVLDEGWVPDLRQAMASLSSVRQRQAGTAVLYDMDHTEGTYASALHLAVRFERVVLLTPRSSFADDMALVTRQTLLRRMAQAGIELCPLSEPVWDMARFESGVVPVRHLYGGPGRLIEDVVLLTYATPRARADALREALRQRTPELPVHCVGDCASPRDMLAATSEGHAIGMAL
jgi:hypothetical protein